MNLILDLFLSFAKIGLFTFGGGYAMIALIESICVEKKGWITHDETVCCLYHQKKDFISVPYEPKDASYIKQR